MRTGRRDARDGRRRALALVAALSAGGACAPVGEDGAWALYRQLEQAEEVAIGAPAGWAREAAERMAPRLEAELGRRVVVCAPAAAHPGPGRVRMLIGNASTPELEPALSSLGAQVSGAGAITFGEGLGPGRREFGGPEGGALVATLPDPERAGAPLTVFVALEAPDPVGRAHLDLDLARSLRPTWRTGWRVVGGSGLLLAQGGLDSDGRALVEHQASSVPPPERGLADLIAEQPGLASLRAVHVAARQRVVAALGLGSALDGFEPRLRLHTEPEAMARDLGGWSHYRCAPASGRIDLLVAPGLVGSDVRAAFAEICARRGAGEPAEDWLLDGLVRSAAGKWWGRDLGAWCAHLQRAGMVPPLEELVAPAPRRSPHQLEPLRGLLVEVLLETRGAEELGRLWREGGLVVDEGLRAAFRARLSRLVGRHAGALEADLRARREQALARGFRRGVGLALPRRERGELSGLASSACAERLAHAARLGADAVSIEVAAFVERPWPEAALLALAPRAAQASDLELAAAIRAARALDLDVMLAPRLWLSPASTYAGRALVYTFDEWQRLFDEYGRFLDHYALTAELAGAQLLCLGGELPVASLTVEGRADGDSDGAMVAWRRARWRDLAARTRGAFGGAQTYAAGWDGEAEGVGFWDALDYVGLVLYAPQAAPEAHAPPDQSELARRLQHTVSRAETVAAGNGKRLLVVEAGASATRDAWAEPELPRGPGDERAQARFLTALDEVHGSRGDGGTLAGLFVGPWSAASPTAGMERSHFLQGELTELALERLFRRP